MAFALCVWSTTGRCHLCWAAAVGGDLRQAVPVPTQSVCDLARNTGGHRGHLKDGARCLMGPSSRPEGENAEGVSCCRVTTGDERTPLCSDQPGPGLGSQPPKVQQPSERRPPLCTLVDSFQE